MYYFEYETTEEEVLSLIMEAVHDEDNSEFRRLIIDPIIAIIETPEGKKRYIEYGNNFLEANADMLAKEYPTKAVSFPRRYVDEIFKLFNFDMNEFKEIIKREAKLRVSATSELRTFMNSISNVFHIVVLYYSDMILNRKLRDSARQQLGLCIYNNIYDKYYKIGVIDNIMAYTYSTLNRSWGLVRSENMITWICDTVDVAYAFWKTRMSLNMSIKVMVDFSNRTRDGFNQNMRLLSNRYYENKDNSNIGKDVDASDEHLESNSTTKLRQNLVRLIKAGDRNYRTKSQLYTVIARMKNVKMEALYDFAQQIEYKDIERTMDTILYVFIIRDNNKIIDINSSKYISRITNMPTQVDRAIQGKPLVLPFSEKYKVPADIVRAYICLIATYILNNVNDVDH